MDKHAVFDGYDPAARGDFKLGDRIVVTRPGPWNGKRGTIVELGEERGPDNLYDDGRYVTRMDAPIDGPGPLSSRRQLRWFGNEIRVLDAVERLAELS